MVNKKIAILSGDGIGPEVMESALEVLKLIEKLFNHNFDFKYLAVGGYAYEKYGEHLPKSTIDGCINSDAILFGSVGGPVDSKKNKKWENCEKNSILYLRKKFNFNINIRPINTISEISNLSPLKLKNIVNIEIFRELSSDIYFGEHRTYIDAKGKYRARDIAEYDEDTIRDIVKKAFLRANERKKKLTSVDKANVLDTSKLWRNIVNEESLNYPNVELEHMYIDNCAMQLILQPESFDVIVTSNLFGDILSDLASTIPGSIGLIPSISLNNDRFGLYEPAGGSAYSLSGRDIANPIAQILSAALMLEYSFYLKSESELIKSSIFNILKHGVKTADLTFHSKENHIGTKEFTKYLINEINHKYNSLNMIAI